MADLFGAPLRLVDERDRRAALRQLKSNGIRPTTLGRGRTFLYVDDRYSVCVVARKRHCADGTRWSFTRHGRLTRAQVKFLHDELTTA